MLFGEKQNIRFFTKFQYNLQIVYMQKTLTHLKLFHFQFISGVCLYNELLLLFFYTSGYLIPSLKHVEKVLCVLTTRDVGNKHLFVILFTVNTASCFMYILNTNIVRASSVLFVCHARGPANAYRICR